MTTSSFFDLKIKNVIISNVVIILIKRQLMFLYRYEGKSKNVDVTNPVYRGILIDSTLSVSNYQPHKQKMYESIFKKI